MSNGPDRDTAIDIYRTMARIAATDLRICQGLAAGNLQFQYYPCGGQEAIPASIAPLLTTDDKSVITISLYPRYCRQGDARSERSLPKCTDGKPERQKARAAPCIFPTRTAG